MYIFLCFIIASSLCLCVSSNCDVQEDLSRSIVLFATTVCGQRAATTTLVLLKSLFLFAHDGDYMYRMHVYVQDTDRNFDQKRLLDALNLNLKCINILPPTMRTGSRSNVLPWSRV
jgi:hypothetical protein